MRYKLFSYFLFFLLAHSVVAQDVPIGQWRDHLPYRSIKHIAETKDYAYAASDAGLIRISLDENSAQRFSTVEGLAGVEVSALGASPDGDVLLVGYRDGILDIVKGNTITTVYDIFRSSVIGDKSINHFMFYNNRCFISTGFGIVEYDYSKIETRETFLIGEDGAYVFVNQTHAFHDTLWAATRIGLKYAPFNSSLRDPLNWRTDTSIQDTIKEYNIVSSLGEELMVNVGTVFFRQDTLHSRLNGRWGINPFRIGESNRSIVSAGNEFLVASSTSIEVYNTDWSIIRNEFSFDSKGILPNVAVFGKDEVIWIGDEFNGISKNKGAFQNEVTNLGGPASNRSFNVFYDQDKIFVTGGAHATNWFTLKQPAEVSFSDNTDWTILNQNNVDSFKNMRDVTSAAVHPENETFFVSSLNDGIMQFEGDKMIAFYNQNNSILDTIGGGICFISDIKYDAQGNLWILNSGVSKPIVLYTAEGDWYSFALDPRIGTFQTGRLSISSSGHLWITSPSGGLAVYDPGESITSSSDDQSRKFSASPGNGNLPDNETYCAIEDKEGQMWVGTRVGLRVFFNSSNVFSSSFSDAQDILIQQDGQTKVLLENENISWMAVDGANRKWVATRGSGAFLLSADGTEEVEHFTVEDSPLFSNELNSLAINGKTGEVLFATSLGLIGYRGSATEGGSSFSDVYAFPNPVQPNYTGSIAITGLVDKTVVKITDSAGNLVFETTSNGGQALWNGNTLLGQRATAGVYFVAANGNEGEEKIVTKILLLR